MAGPDQRAINGPDRKRVLTRLSFSKHLVTASFSFPVPPTFPMTQSASFPVDLDASGYHVMKRAQAKPSLYVELEEVWMQNRVL